MPQDDCGVHLPAVEELKQAARISDPEIELVFSCPRRIREVVAEVGWWTPARAYASILLDKTGETTELLRPE